MTTTFMLLAEFQVHENYGMHVPPADGSIAHHWKAKGGDQEVILSEVSLSDAANLDADALRDLVAKRSKLLKWNNEFYQHDLLRFELVECSPHVVREVRRHLTDYPNDPGYARYNWGWEAQFDWAIEQMN